MTEDLKQIKPKDLKMGNYIINLGRVQQIDKDPDCYNITVIKFNETQIYKFLPGEQLMICEHVIIDDPMEFLLSPKIRNDVQRLFTTTRVEIKNKQNNQSQEA